MLHALRSRETGLNWKFNLYVKSTLGRNLVLSNNSFQFNADVSSVNCIDCENAENRYVLAGYGNGSISIFDTCIPSNTHVFPAVGSINRLYELCHRYSVEGVQWYPHDTGLFFSLSADRTLKIWDTNELQMAEQFQFSDTIHSFHVSEKAKKHSLVAVACEDSKIYLCDVKTGSKTHFLKGHKGAVLTTRWSPRNENILVSGSSDKHIYIWDVRKVKSVLMSLELNDGSGAHRGQVNGMKFTSDGVSLLSFGTDHQLRLWDVNSGNVTKVNYGRIENNRSKNIHFDVSKGVVNDLVFIPTMYHLDVFQIYTGKYIQSLSGHFMPVNSCCYNKSYQELYSGSADTKILHWSTLNKVPNDDEDNWSDVE
ncbi:DNA excision repair protein ERCC-8-like isoform X2 [Hydractinia symbiolongicarpus]|uniref:DNA excision repair protein ERCC-8-like isoform X2 n=1 Tax=Hydractinia symbiolongicarpus TaxID=13093 RepID=UPI00254E09D5|nr:DNA excision repair protein ERCC-8-like isoform X2 [Hydractinia symbiolongicarpus]